MDVHCRKMAAVLAASLSIAAMVVMAVPAKADNPWAGFYAGVQAGYQWTDVDYSANVFRDGSQDEQFTNDEGIFDPSEVQGDQLLFAPQAEGFIFPSFGDQFNVNAFVGGAHVGYNFGSGPFVYGVEADLEIASGKGTGSSQFQYGKDFFGFNGVPDTSGTNGETDAALEGATYTSQAKAKQEWQASLRGRFGWATDRTLVYVTGGLAFAEFDYTVTSIADFSAVSTDFEETPFPGPVAVSETKGFSKFAIGLTVGAGAEFLLTDNISLGAEYRFTGWNSINEDVLSDFVNLGTDTTFDLDSHAVRARLTYHFSY